VIYKAILGENKLLYFIVMAAIVVGSSVYINIFIMSDALVYSTYAERLSVEQVESMLNVNKALVWVSYLFIPVAILIKILYNSFCLYLGTFLEEKYGTFRDFFNIALKAELIFCVAIIVKIVFCEFIIRVKNLDDLNFIPFSLQHLLSGYNYPKWITYPLQTANLFEVFYVLFIGKLIAVNRGLTLNQCIRFAALSYFFGVLFWVLIVVYLTMLIS